MYCYKWSWLTVVDLSIPGFWRVTGVREVILCHHNSFWLACLSLYTKNCPKFQHNVDCKSWFWIGTINSQCMKTTKLRQPHNFTVFRVWCQLCYQEYLQTNGLTCKCIIGHQIVFNEKHELFSSSYQGGPNETHKIIITAPWLHANTDRPILADKDI